LISRAGVVPKPLLARFFEGNHPVCANFGGFATFVYFLGLIALSPIRMFLPAKIRRSEPVYGPQNAHLNV
jgi:hypothetical protein